MPAESRSLWKPLLWIAAIRAASVAVDGTVAGVLTFWIA